MKHRSITTLILVVVGTASPLAQADRRIFGYTYPYQTLPKGTLELEHYLDVGLNGWDDPATPEADGAWSQADWKHQLEFEYGITDRLDFGFYNVFRQKPFGKLSYDGVKLRSRYRFGEQGQRWIDPAVYLEVAYTGDEVKLEEILILGKRLGRLEIAFNAKLEQAFALADRAWEFEFFPLLGVGYHFAHHFALSLEYFGKLKIEEGRVDYYVSYLGPAFSVAGGPFFWTVAIQPQLGGKKSLAAVQIRSLFGVVF